MIHRADFGFAFNISKSRLLLKHLDNRVTDTAKLYVQAINTAL